MHGQGRAGRGLVDGGRAYSPGVGSGSSALAGGGGGVEVGPFLVLLEDGMDGIFDQKDTGMDVQVSDGFTKWAAETGVLD